MFNTKNHILHRREVLSQKDCEYLIHYFESQPELHLSGSVGGSDVQLDSKISTEIMCDFPTHFSWIKVYMERCIDEYKKAYPFITQIAPGNIFSRYKLQRYLPGEGFFKLHCENTGPALNEEPILRRSLAWMIYLNDVKDGGHTEFPSQNRRFQPRTGDVLLWPAYFTHPHRGIVSKSETKYIITGWYVFDKIT